MLAIFESILPIFLLIVLGNLLRRLPFIDENAWPGLEQIGYWFLYPALLFASIYNADFSGLRPDLLFGSLVAGVVTMIVLLGLSWPLLDRAGLAAHSEYSSIFQTALRWNGFIALAVAQNIFPPEGAAVAALAMAAVIIPINVASVFVVTRFASAEMDWWTVAARISVNPLILASLAALIFRFLPIGIYGPLGTTLDLIARAALGMGLVVIGAGLKPADMLTVRTAYWLPVFLKLIVFPAIVLSIALAIGVRGPELNYLALCAAVPTAMNGYLLARQMGGDAELYAAVVTLQTALSFLTVPLVLAVAGQISSA